MTKNLIKGTLALLLCVVLILAMHPSLHKSNNHPNHQLTPAYNTDSAGYAGAIKASVGSLSWLVAVNTLNNGDISGQ